MGGMKGVNGCGQTAAQSGFRGLRGGGRGGTAAERRTGQRHGGRCLKGGGRSGENGQNLKMKKKARWSLAAVERRADGVRRQEAEMDLTETYMKRFASCASHVGEE